MSFGLVLVYDPSFVIGRIYHIGNEHAMTNRKRKIVGIWLALVLLYVLTYLQTTTFRQTGGQGGLSGPPTAREFSGIGHLLAFYPCYLTERWFREVGSKWAHPFGVEFKDGNYPLSFLYGDNKYSSFWLSWLFPK